MLWLPLSKKCLPWWLCECITQDYKQAGRDPSVVCALYMWCYSLNGPLSSYSSTSWTSQALSLGLCMWGNKGLVQASVVCKWVSVILHLTPLFPGMSPCSDPGDLICRVACVLTPGSFLPGLLKSILFLDPQLG